MTETHIEHVHLSQDRHTHLVLAVEPYIAATRDCCHLAYSLVKYGGERLHHVTFLQSTYLCR